MKTISIAMIMILLRTNPGFAGSGPGNSSCCTNETGTAFTILDKIQAESENIQPNTPALSDVQSKIEMRRDNSAQVFDKIQDETESIAISRPLLTLAEAIEKKLAERKGLIANPNYDQDSTIRSGN